MGWTESQIEYLDNNLGNKSIMAIAKSLGKESKTVDAYRLRTGRPNCREAADGISVTEFAAVVGRCTESIYDWIELKGLPVKRIPVGVNGRKEIFICQENFWKWASKNKRFIDFSKIERLIFGEEPDWVEDQRRYDYCDWVKKGWDRPWSEKEDAILLSMLKLNKFTFRELSDALKRSELAIQQRLYQTKVKLRPIPEERRNWTEDEVKSLEELYRDNQNIFTISRLINRSEIQVKTKISRLGLTKKSKQKEI